LYAQLTKGVFFTVICALNFACSSYIEIFSLLGCYTSCIAS